MNKQNIAFIGITLGVFFILFFSKVFQHGLFFDGLIYSSLSNNLSNGLGTFWNPYFSETIYPHFFEHPPLVFGLQSGFMQVFDGAFFSEKLFGFITACLVVLFLSLIWRKVATDRYRHLYWLPVLFWVITPKNSWAFSNNLLENTMAVFSLASIYFLLTALNKEGTKRYLILMLTGVLLFSAFLAKGFPGLFPLAFFFFYGLVFKKQYSIKRFVLDTTILVLSTAIVFFLVFYFNEAAKNNLATYFETQVFGSITGKSRVGSRIVLMKNLFNELIPLLIISAIFIGVFWKRKKELFKENKGLLKWAFFFLIIGLSASVPLMVSLKISSFYLITALPYFDLMFAFLLSAFIVILVERLAKKKIGHGIALGLGGIALTVGLVLTILNANTIGRDDEIFNDMEVFTPYLKERSIVSLHSSFHSDWTTIAYFQRYLSVNMDRSENLGEFYLIPRGEIIPQGYSLIVLDTQKFDLLKKSGE